MTDYYLLSTKTGRVRIKAVLQPITTEYLSDMSHHKLSKQNGFYAHTAVANPTPEGCRKSSYNLSLPLHPTPH